jgi:hypothetical protein
MITTLDQAKATFNELAAVELEIAKADAAFEHRIAKLKASHIEATADKTALHADLAEMLVAFVANNKSLFKDPRKVKTNMGAFGLQTVTDLLITDLDALDAAILERGYEGCMEVKRSPVKKAISARIAAGEQFPGCTVRSGDTVVYAVKKALVDQAKQEAE